MEAFQCRGCQGRNGAEGFACPELTPEGNYPNGCYIREAFEELIRLAGEGKLDPVT